MELSFFINGRLRLIKRPFFQKINVHEDNYIKFIKEIKNIVQNKDGTHFFVYNIGLVPAVYDSVTFDAESTLAIAAFGGNRITNNVIIREVNGVLNACIIRNNFEDFWNLVHFYSYDDGATWAIENEGNITPAPSQDLDDDLELYDIVYVNSIYWLIYLYYDDSTGNVTLFAKLLKFPAGGTVYVTGDTDYGNINHFFGGRVQDDGDYHYVEYYDSKFYNGVFDGSTFTRGSEITDFEVPSSFDARNQLFWDKDNVRFCMMTNRLYWYDFINKIYTNYSITSASGINAIFWTLDHLGKYITPGFAWGDAIWEITDKGVLKKKQALEPRDYKKVYLTNTNENLTGVVQFQDRNGNDDLSDWNRSTDTSEIVLEYQGHQKVFRIVEELAGSDINYLIFTAQISGSIEWNAREIVEQSRGHIGDGANVRMWIRYEPTQIKFGHGNGAGGVTFVTHVFTTAFPHIKITFDCVTDTWSAWCEGVELFTDENFYLDLTSTTLNRMEEGAFDGSHGTELYIDSIGFSWDGYVSGSNKKINAYVGYGSDIDEAWFSTGDPDTSIMQLSFKDYTSGTVKSLVVSEIYKAPKHTLIRRTKPFEDEWIDEYTDAGKLFYGGKVKDNDSDNRFWYKYLMKTWEDENEETKVNVNLVDYNHGDLLKYVLDNFSKYRKYGRGTNVDVNEFTADQIDGSDTDWTNSDGTGCTSSYVEKQGFANDFLYNILKQLDNGAGVCLVDYEISGNLVYSGWMASSDITDQIKIEFYENATRIGYIEINASKIRWYDGSANDILDPAVNDTDYHWSLVFSATADTVDIYINGTFISTESLENNITTEITKIRFTTDAATVGPTGYHSNLYVGNSLIDAMHTYSSISPLLTTTKNFPLRNESIPGIYKLIAEETGYIVSERPDGMVYLDQYAPSGQIIDMQESSENTITFVGRLKDRNEKFSLITFYGGFVNGKQIISQGFGEPNFGSYEDWFPEIQGQDVGDIYYDDDGNPKSHRLDAMITTALVNRNIRVKKVSMGKRGVGMLNPGTSLTYNSNHYKISMEPWNCWRKNKYNGITDDNRVEIADSFLSPTKSDPEDTPIDQANANIATNADNIVKVEQNVGQNAEDADAGKFGPAGFENRTDSTIAMTTSTFGITGEYFVYCNNVRIYKDGDSVDMSAFADGIWYFYYNASDGVFTYSQTPWVITAGHALIATVYKNGANYLLAEERHSTPRDLWWHRWAHDTLGCRYENNGGLAGAFTDVDAEITSGEIHDEDIEIDITGTDPYQFSIFYRDGDLEWVWTAAQDEYWHDVADIVQFDDGGTLTDVNNASHVAYWIFATNHLDVPQIISVMGQRQDTTLASAKLNNTPQGLALGDLPSAEWVLLYRVILKRVGNNVSMEDTQDYRTSGVNTVGVSTLTDHGALSGLDVVDAHSVYQSMLAIGEDNVQWIPTSFQSSTISSTFVEWAIGMSNAGADDTNLIYLLNLPTTKGNLNLYISGVRAQLFDADATDYISRVTVIFGTDTTLGTVNDQNPPDPAWNTSGEKEELFTAVNCGSYRQILVYLYGVFATANEFDVLGVQLLCHYA